VWTSTNQLSFLALTASWITEDWELVISLIDFILLKGVHSGANMAGLTYKTLEEFEMKHKVSYRLAAGEVDTIMLTNYHPVHNKHR
jgi:hypothetical protein